MGLISIEDESYPAHVIPLQADLRTPSIAYLQTRLRGNRQVPQVPRRSLRLTDLGRSMAPGTPSYPWRPNTGGTSDITFSEEERQRKIAAYAVTSGRAPPSPAHRPFRGEIPSNVVVAAFRDRRS